MDLAHYVPVQDQLCNYCQDYSAPTVPIGGPVTLYRPGIGYPDEVAKIDTELAKG